jgi:hypothetical protein
MTQIKDISITKTVADTSDFLVLQSPTGETYKISKANFLQGTGTSPGTGGNSTEISDPHFSNVKALLHFDGTNGSDIFVDVIGNNVVKNGSPKIDTSVSKYGGASALFLSASNDYITLPQMNFGTGDFTIEAWVYPISTVGGSTGIMGLMGQQEVYISVFGNTLTFWQNNGFVYSFGSNPPVNTWTHLAISRNAGVIRLFMNGVLVNTQNNSVNLSVPGNFNIGKTGDGQYQTYWNGNIDEFRITIGTGRYTTDFALPLAAFPNA